MLRSLARFLRRSGPSADVRDGRDVAAQATASPDPDPLLEEPSRALREGRADEAVALLEAQLEARPDSPRAHLMLGEILHKRKQRDDARDHFLLASAFSPG